MTTPKQNAPAAINNEGAGNGGGANAVASVVDVQRDFLRIVVWLPAHEVHTLANLIEERDLTHDGWVIWQALCEVAKSIAPTDQCNPELVRAVLQANGRFNDAVGHLLVEIAAGATTPTTATQAHLLAVALFRDRARRAGVSVAEGLLQACDAHDVQHLGVVVHGHVDALRRLLSRCGVVS